MKAIQRYGPDVLAIRADPEIIDDLYLVLEKLLSLSRVLKNKTRVIHAEMNAQSSERAVEQKRRFDELSLGVYLEYMKHQGQGLARPESVKRLVHAHGLQFYEAELYVSNGRRVQKAHRDREIQDQVKDGKALAEIAALHGLSARTVQRILAKTA